MENVLGGPLQECGLDPVTGFTRSGSCEVTVDDVGVHGICAVMTEDFLDHQYWIGNDLLTPRAAWGFPGLRPGDRWCVVADRWVQAERDLRAAPVVLASTHVSVLQLVPLSLLQRYAVDVPDDLSGLAQG
ncbi:MULTISPECIES: DUF2237 family protein [unclassified Serinicoccus]|uniref:DUF2237 family protein n=1 Tax=unclassified Serinicoccus TaxID=2643101 RepID=UPI003854EA88